MKSSVAPGLFSHIYIWWRRSKDNGSQGRSWLGCTSSEEVQEGQGSFLGGQLLFFIMWHWWTWRLGRHCGRPYINKRPQQRWCSFVNLIFFRGVSPHIRSFWSFDDKGGEFWGSLQAGLSIWVFFFKLQLSFFCNFIGSSCKLKPDGALILLICFSACLFLVNIIARMLNYISHHISSCISNSSYIMSNACMNYKI